MTEVAFSAGSILPVTALKFIKVENKEYLLAGEGPCLKLCTSGGKWLCSVEVLPFGVIHGIKILDCEGVILIFGQKSFRFVKTLCLEQGSSGGLELGTEVVELSDWLLDVKPFHWTDCRTFSVAAITAHNVCILYQMTQGHPRWQLYHSQVSCILYSASLLSGSENQLAVVSGTVVNKVLLWAVGPDRSDKLEVVRVVFSGHEGVIFSVELDEERLRLATASDDRTVRIWSVPPNWRDLEEKEESSCLLVLYGHSARVWRASFLPKHHCDGIVSIGEDATCRVWGFDGSVRNVLKGHKGKSIWSLALSLSGETLATGGGDCSIRTYALQPTATSRIFSYKPRSEGQPAVMAAPRLVFLVGQTPLCLTDEGCLLAGTWASKDIIFQEVYRDLNFSGYSVGAISQTSPAVLALGNLNGCIMLLKLDTGGHVLQKELVVAYGGKVFSLCWDVRARDQEYLVSCGPEGEVVCWIVQLSVLAVEKMARLSLPSSRHRWLSTVTVIEASPVPEGKLVVLGGDRRGSVHLYLVDKGDVDSPSFPLQSLHGIHGTNGVTYSCVHDGFIYTCGRNGECRKFELVIGDGISLVEVLRFKPVRGMNWLERILFVDHDLVVMGFHGTELIVHSTSQNRPLVSIPCGGGHRSYGVHFVPDDLDMQLACVVYIKQGHVCYSEVAVHGFSSTSLLQEPFVGLEALSMVVLKTCSTKHVLVAVGSEDCSIGVYSLPATAVAKSSIEPVLTLQGHVSAVKALSRSWSPHRQLLFSGGGRASLKVWSVTENMESGRILVGLDKELYLHEPVKKKIKFQSSGAEVAPECRVMSLTSFSLLEVFRQSDVCHSHYVAAGCSDGVIRQYTYDDKEFQFHELPSMKTGEKCVLCVKHFFHKGEMESSSFSSTLSWISTPLLYSSATDGHISIWDLVPFLWDHFSPPVTADARASQHSPVRFKVHQSGVNSMDVCLISPPDCYLFLSGGDDNALAVTCLGIGSEGVYDTNGDGGGSHGNGASGKTGLTANVLWQLLEPAAHSSALTGVCFVTSELLISTSIDQRLNMWRVDAEEKTLKLVHSRTHDVADSSSLLVHSSSEEVTVMVCGIGMQYFRFSASNISFDQEQK